MHPQRLRPLARFCNFLYSEVVVGFLQYGDTRMKIFYRSTLVKLGLFSAILVVLALLSNHPAGAQANGKPHGTAETPASQWADLTAQVQQNGKVNVIVSINSPAFYAAVNSNKAVSQAAAKANAPA